MNKILIKGRERLMKGKLSSFSELPIDKQEFFKKIKEMLNKYVTTEVFIFGSYNHGYWDEFSDYDVIIFNHTYIDISQKITKELGVKVDIFFGRNNYGYIEIP